MISNLAPFEIRLASTISLSCFGGQPNESRSRSADRAEQIFGQDSYSRLFTSVRRRIARTHCTAKLHLPVQASSFDPLASYTL